MKLLRLGESGHERPGAIDNTGKIRDLSSLIDDFSGENLSDAVLMDIRNRDLSSLPEVSENLRLGPCVPGNKNFICIGLNYSDHAAEAGMAEPAEPIFFLKATSSICGPDDDIVIPQGSDKTDWEVELGVVIGKGGQNILEEDAMKHVAGYCVANDLSERQFQFKNAGQWVMGKSCPSFGPIGPWLVTRDEIEDPQNLDLWLDVDNQRFQQGNTGKMVFTVAQIIAYLSRYLVLSPGDIIATGTPPGVGMGIKPEPVYLKEGQSVCAGISGLGFQNKTVVGSN